MPVAPPRRRAVTTRAAAAVAIVLCALAAILTLLAVLLDTEAVTRRVVEQVLPRASERLGRDVQLESATARLLPRPRVTLHGLTVAGRPGEPPLLEAPEASLELSLWTLVKSFGREVHVRGVRVVRPELNLVRAKDGTWSFEGLGSGAPPEREVRIDFAAVEDATVRVIDRSGAHGEATVALTRLDLTLRELAADRPLRLVANAAVASDAQNLSLDVRVDRSGPTPVVDGHLALTRAELTRLEGLLPARLGTVLMGGHVDLDGEVTTGADGAWELEAQARLDAVRLRGEPASGGLRLAARVDPAAPRDARVEVDQLSLRGPGVALGGRATLTAAPWALDFALKGPLLDLDALLAVLPEERVTQPPPRTSLLPARTRRALDEVRASGTLRLERVVRGGLELRDLDAQVELARGVLSVEKAEAGLHGGRMDARGSRVDLLLAHPAWTLKARLQDVDLAALTAAVKARAPLSGRLDASLDLAGEGAAWAQVRENVTGRGVLSIRDGALGSADLGGQLAALGAPGLPGRAGGQTPLRDLTLSFRVAEGRMTLREPLAFSSDFGAARLDGSLGLDTSLALTGTVRVGQVEVPLRVGGTLAAPELGLPSPEDVARRVAAPAARRVEEEVKRQARRRAGEVLRKLGRED